MTETSTSTEPASWRAVVLPREHGGWGLTLEPVLLGLLVRASVAGLALGLAAFVAFLARTPVRVVLVDRWRNRSLVRTRFAAKVAAAELAVLGALALVAGWAGGWSWLVPVLVAAPLVIIELWFEMRSRSRRLVPELCGACGIAAVAASIALAGGTGARVAVACWFVLAARAVGAIPFVRTQIVRLRRGAAPRLASDILQFVAIALATVAVVVSPRVFVGLGGVIALAVCQLVWLRRPPVVAKVLGLRQLFVGLALVMATAVGVWAT